MGGGIGAHPTEQLEPVNMTGVISIHDVDLPEMKSLISRIYVAGRKKEDPCRYGKHIKPRRDNFKYSRLHDDTGVQLVNTLLGRRGGVEEGVQLVLFPPEKYTAAQEFRSDIADQANVVFQVAMAIQKFIKSERPG